MLSMTSPVSPCPKFSLFPTLTFLAGSTKTSQVLSFWSNSRSRKTSILASVFSLLPNSLAGKTLVLFKIKVSPSSKYWYKSLKNLCSIFLFFL
nr:hypothetical protein [Blattabacterium cuenoti]